TTSTAKEGNERVGQDYDKMFLHLTKTEKKTYQSNYRSRNKPDWLCTYIMEDHKDEFLYGEATGPPFLADPFKTEGDRRKLIRSLLQCTKLMEKVPKEHFPSIDDNNIIKHAKSIPRFGMLLYGMVQVFEWFEN
ncbi:9145_t:CDS:1, partial [Scutellospora calospora]